MLKTYAYFDWRDLDFTTDWMNCSGNDMTVRYDANLGKLKFFNTSSVDLNTQIDLILNNGDLITWADWRCDFRTFTPFWSNGLVIAPDASNHPRIVWGPYGDISGSSLTYKVYKAVNHSSTPPPLSSFNLIASVSESTYDYTDEDFVVGGNLYFHYYIKCSYVPTGKSAAVFTPPTNVVTTEASLSYKITEENRHLANDYLLNQNYPNPFNPITKILYSIKEEGFVTLKVYDILGKEVAILANENRPAGTYEAEFNASHLPSGLYIYKIQAGQFSDVKKMLLTK